MFVNVELIYNNTYKFIQFTYKVPKKYQNKIFIIDRDKLIYESSVENKNIIAQHIVKNTTS